MSDDNTEIQRQHNSDIYAEMTRLNNELTNVQRELAKKNAALIRLNEEKNELLGVAAHELRNPLGAVLLNAELLEAATAELLNDEQSCFLRDMQSNLERMIELLDQLLDVSQIEAGKLQLRPAPTDMLALATRSVTTKRTLAARKQIQIVIGQDGELPPLLIDASKIEQVLDNLLLNALKFSAPKTTVRIRLRQVGQSALISVSNEGPGIPQQELAAVFEPYTQASVKSTHNEKGSGLGLAIVRKIVEGHGGSVRMESSIGQGVTVDLSLPIDQPR